jgi:hypothetical protein
MLIVLTKLDLYIQDKEIIQLIGKITDKISCIVNNPEGYEFNLEETPENDIFANLIKILRFTSHPNDQWLLTELSQYPDIISNTQTILLACPYNIMHPTPQDHNKITDRFSRTILTMIYNNRRSMIFFPEKNIIASFYYFLNAYNPQHKPYEQCLQNFKNHFKETGFYPPVNFFIAPDLINYHNTQINNANEVHNALSNLVLLGNYPWVIDLSQWYNIQQLPELIAANHKDSINYYNQVINNSRVSNENKDLALKTIDALGIWHLTHKSKIAKQVLDDLTRIIPLINCSTIPWVNGYEDLTIRIEWLIQVLADCAQAYNGPNGLSCSRGIFERLLALSIEPGCLILSYIYAFKDLTYLQIEVQRILNNTNGELTKISYQTGMLNFRMTEITFPNIKSQIVTYIINQTKEQCSFLRCELKQSYANDELINQFNNHANTILNEVIKIINRDVPEIIDILIEDQTESLNSAIISANNTKEQVQDLIDRATEYCDEEYVQAIITGLACTQMNPFTQIDEIDAKMYHQQNVDLNSRITRLQEKRETLTAMQQTTNIPTARIISVESEIAKLTKQIAIDQQQQINYSADKLWDRAFGTNDLQHELK